MERISEFDLDKELASVYSGGQMDQDVVRLALQELKERWAADSKELDIKAQLRIVRDRCPTVWNAFFADRCPRIIMNDYSMDCPQRLPEESCDRNFTGYTPNLIIRCWDKALEGDK